MKKVFLMIFILFVTGCSCEYNMVINNDTISENVNIAIPSDVTDSETIDNQTSYPLSVYSDRTNYYSFFKNEKDGNYNLNYSFIHNIKKFSKSYFFVSCFKSNDVSIDESSISINTSDKFNCIKMADGAYLDDVKVNITTDLKVLDNNADTVSGKTYTWLFNENDYNKSISIKLEKIKKPSKNNSTSRSSSFSYGLLILVIVIAICVIIVIFIRYRNKKSNDF